MKRADIIRALDGIVLYADIDQIAHGKETALYISFIKYIASLNDDNDLINDLSEKAKLVLTADNIEFRRWYG
jgi:hypothetical protein